MLKFSFALCFSFTLLEEEKKIENWKMRLGHVHLIFEMKLLDSTQAL